MPQVPFPHILIIPNVYNNNQFNVVTPDQVVEGGYVQEPDMKQLNKVTNQMEMTYKTYRIDAIEEQRPARGTWTNWNCHPTFYKTKAVYIGVHFQAVGNVLPNLEKATA